LREIRLADRLALARQILASQAFVTVVGTEVMAYGEGMVELRMRQNEHDR
jgi:hypothetical protein